MILPYHTALGESLFSWLDPQLLCTDRRYEEYVPLVAVGITIFVIGIPAFYLFLLFPARSVLKPAATFGFSKRGQATARARAIDAVLTRAKVTE